jgi:hypothetical protein
VAKLLAVRRKAASDGANTVRWALSSESGVVMLARMRKWARMSKLSGLLSKLARPSDAKPRMTSRTVFFDELSREFAANSRTTVAGWQGGNAAAKMVSATKNGVVNLALSCAARIAIKQASETTLDGTAGNSAIEDNMYGRGLQQQEENAHVQNKHKDSCGTHRRTKSSFRAIHRLITLD